MTTEADRINARIADEAQHIARTRIDLDAFLALSSTERAARWRQMDRAGKWDLVTQAITRQVGDWMTEEVERAIEHWDARYALPASETAVCAALERMAEETAQHARVSRAAGEKDDAKFFQRASNAYAKALGFYQNGLRPVQTERGWMLPSQRAGEPPHLLHKDGDWVCCCPSGEHIHWASALIIGLEIAGDDMDRFDDPMDAAPAELGKRLAEARARYLEAA